jgi:predicted small secreted protein
MQPKLALLLIAAAAALAGCNTWQGAKQDAKDAGSAVTNAVGSGLEKTGQGLDRAGSNVKSAGDQDKDKAPTPAPAQ